MIIIFSLFNIHFILILILLIVRFKLLSYHPVLIMVWWCFWFSSLLAIERRINFMIKILILQAVYERTFRIYRRYIEFISFCLVLLLFIDLLLFFRFMVDFFMKYYLFMKFFMFKLYREWKCIFAWTKNTSWRNFDSKSGKKVRS